MTTKRALLIASGVVAAIALVVALVAGSVVGFAFYTLDRSAAAQTAKTFLRQNERLKQEIGGVRDFGYFTTGNIGSAGAPGNAELRLKTIGANRTVNTTVLLSTREGHDWRVVDAYFDDASGQRIYLTKNFDDADAQDDNNSPTAGDEGDADEANNANSDGSSAKIETGEPSIGGDEDKPRTFDEQDFKASVLESKSPVLVVLGSLTNSDSLALYDSIQSVAPKYEEKIDLVDYSLDEQPELRARFKVKRTPTIIVFKDGREQERLAGKITADELSRLLDKYLDK
jgi:thiol-disulfide isomerase/thioredoxin